MELYILNRSLRTIGVIDTYTSIIWTKRCFACGDFELYLPASHLDILVEGNYIYRLDDDAIMRIENLEITTDSEVGNFLRVSGRSAESLLAKRIIWSQTTFSGTVENLIYKLIRENAVNPTDENRIIPLLTIGESQGYPETIEKQITGTNLLEAISELCTTYQYGFKFTLQDGQFVFSLYKGKETSVVFSPEFDNLINTTYQRNTSAYANVALVAGEGEGASRKTCSVGNATGLDRSEIYVDARDLSTNSEEPISDEKYTEILNERGTEALTEYVVTEGFEGNVEPSGTYEYKTDWNLGDVVQVVNEYGIVGNPRIVEIIESEDENGHSIIPTFTTWETLDTATYLTTEDGDILTTEYGELLEV